MVFFFFFFFFTKCHVSMAPRNSSPSFPLRLLCCDDFVDHGERLVPS